MMQINFNGSSCQISTQKNKRTFKLKKIIVITKMKSQKNKERKKHRIKSLSRNAK